MTQANFTKSYNGFSGVDMIVTFGGRWIGELQGISYSVSREKVPTYTMGSPDPRAFSRGKRGIAGALVFAFFDKSALLEEMNQITRTNSNVPENKNTIPSGYKHFSKNPNTINPEAADVASISLQQESNIYYDQILPFNVVITGANEYGASTSMEIQGIELLNSGSGMSIDDIQVNESCSFLARGIVHWKSININSGFNGNK
jgi:hypothetical protein